MIKVIRISAIWCMSCLVMRNRLDKILRTYQINQILDLDFDDDDISKYQIGDVLPVVIIEKDGHEIKRIIGEKSKKDLSMIFEDIQTLRIDA